jgi:hypothetical protein
VYTSAAPIALESRDWRNVDALRSFCVLDKWLSHKSAAFTSERKLSSRVRIPYTLAIDCARSTPPRRHQRAANVALTRDVGVAANLLRKKPTFYSSALRGSPIDPQFYLRVDHNLVCTCRNPRFLKKFFLFWCMNEWKIFCWKF